MSHDVFSRRALLAGAAVAGRIPAVVASSTDFSANDASLIELQRFD